MKNNYEKFTVLLMGITVFIGFIFVLSVFISGGAWLADKLLPGFLFISIIITVLNVLVFIPAAFFVKARRMSGRFIFLSSFVLALTLWIWSLILTYKCFGWIGVIIGVILLGIGVIPIGIIAAFLSAQFTVLFYLILLAVLSLALRKAGLVILLKYISEKVDETGNYSKYSDSVIDVEYIDKGDKEI